MVDYIPQKAAHLKRKLEAYNEWWTPTNYPANTVLLAEGQTAKKAYFIQHGCLRTWFNHDGKEVTFQFFFEGQSVCSFESFWTQQPSTYYIETLESSTIYSISKTDYDRLLAEVPELKEVLQEATFQRMAEYQQLFLSRIRDKPQQRYAALCQNQPHVIQRIPQHYIASYLGITPVSLSRLRNKR